MRYSFQNTVTCAYHNIVLDILIRNRFILGIASFLACRQTFVPVQTKQEGVLRIPLQYQFRGFFFFFAVSNKAFTIFARLDCDYYSIGYIGQSHGNL